MQFVHRCVTIEKNRSAKRERRFTMRKYDRKITFFDEILKFPDAFDTVRLVSTVAIILTLCRFCSAMSRRATKNNFLFSRRGRGIEI